MGPLIKLHLCSRRLVDNKDQDTPSPRKSYSSHVRSEQIKYSAGEATSRGGSTGACFVDQVVTEPARGHFMSCPRGLPGSALRLKCHSGCEPYPWGVQGGGKQPAEGEAWSTSEWQMEGPAEKLPDNFPSIHEESHCCALAGPSEHEDVHVSRTALSPSLLPTHSFDFYGVWSSIQ